jgi:hypothetical protein
MPAFGHISSLARRPGLLRALHLVFTMAQQKVIIANDPVVHGLIDEGCKRLALMEKAGLKPAYSLVVEQIYEEKQVRIPYCTLWRRFQGASKAYKDAHGSQQLLSEAAERVLVAWIIFYSETANPLTRETIRQKAQAICNIKPSKNWIYLFLSRWPIIRLGRPSGLDPKRANAFNYPVVTHHFRLLSGVIEKWEIPCENIYNMDEKGCQRGGGRKSLSRKYFVPRNRRPQYKARSANLELVSVIECVCADGTALLPGFVFSGMEFCPEWFDVDDGIL